MAAQLDDTPTLRPDEVAQIVMGVLLERYPALLSIDDELRGEIPAQAASDAAIHDAVDELERLGLVHVLDRFAFASYRAMRTRELT